MFLQRDLYLFVGRSDLPRPRGKPATAIALRWSSRLTHPAAWDSLTRFRREADRAAQWNAAIGSITQFNT